MSEPTAYARITEAQWGTLREMFKQADVTKEGVELRRIFERPFQASPEVIGEAADLIKPWADIRSHVGKTGQVVITFTGPQASGKTLLARAIEKSLLTVGVDPAVQYGPNDRHWRGDQFSPVLLIDRQ